MEKIKQSGVVLSAIALLVILMFVANYETQRKQENTTVPQEKTGNDLMKVTVSTTTPVVSKTTNTGNATQKKVDTTAPVRQVIATGKLAPEILKATGFTNTDPIAMKDFVGKKVVLVNFWSYTSMNSLRVVPYLNQWAWKYKQKGLVVISIHTPRFEFEKQKDNVDGAAFKAGMVHPIVLDNEYATWSAWKPEAWPVQYLVDVNGRISYAHIGEGDYEALEANIQRLLEERSDKLGAKRDTYEPFIKPNGIISIDLTKVKSNETYAGSQRNSSLANGVPLKEGTQDLKLPGAFIVNKLYLSGSWSITPQYASSMTEGSRVVYRYNAKNLYAVLGALRMNKVKVLLDGQPLGANSGKDVITEKGESYVYVIESRVYDIVKGEEYGEHTIEFVVDTPGLRVFTLMFG